MVVGDLCGEGSGMGVQGFAYNTDEMINRPRFSGRMRKIITVAQGHGALHEERAGRGVECPQQVQGLKERRMLRVNGSFARFKSVQTALLCHIGALSIAFALGPGRARSGRLGTSGGPHSLLLQHLN